MTRTLTERQALIETYARLANQLRHGDMYGALVEDSDLSDEDFDYMLSIYERVAGQFDRKRWALEAKERRA